MSNDAFSDFESLLASLTQGSDETIETTALAYLHCIQDHPELVHGLAVAETDRTAVQQRFVRAVRARFGEAISQQYSVLWNQVLPPQTLDVRTTLAWCSVHGYADLLREGGGLAQGLAEVEDMLKALLPALLRRADLEE